MSSSLFLVTVFAIVLNSERLLAVMACPAGLSLAYIRHRDLFMLLFCYIQRIVTVGTLFAHANMGIMTECDIAGALQLEYNITPADLGPYNGQ
jgi:hypothetical protein